jgi:hypothetical protein
MKDNEIHQPPIIKLEKPEKQKVLNTKGLGKVLTPEAKRIILEIKEKASQIDP